MTIVASEPPQRSPVPAERWATSELRLAIVCYGGVSLAIYMHGVTKEIHKLVVASAALEQDPAHNPFGPDTTERVYWDILSRIADRRAGRHASGANIRVVVDIISGTSAGGINGIFLAKALSGNRPQDGLRKLWFEKGDISMLLEWPTWLPWWIRFGAMTVGRRLKPPLRGDDMCRWLLEALDGMNDEQVLPGMDSLLPPDHVLDLYVPITDFHGYEREIPLYDPRFVRDRTHRHVMHFSHHQPPTEMAESQFTAKYDHMLAFSARATSSFPGAFPAVSFGEYAKAVGAEADKVFEKTPFFPLYNLAHFPPGLTHFIDGGVLDNSPFGPAIKAIGAKPAATDVDRRLIFIEPDPGEGGAGPPTGGPGPTMLTTIFGGYAGIPRKEPILDDLLDLAERNEAVLRIRDVIEASFPSIKTKVTALIAGDARAAVDSKSSSADLVGMRQRVEAIAADEANFSAATYLRVRIRSVLEGFAAAVAELLDFPANSYQAAFVGAVLRAWAVSDKLLEHQDEIGVDEAQVVFLSSFDLDYHERRVRFLIAALSWLYTDSGRDGFPSRRELDVAKAKLYEHVFRLTDVLAKLKEDAGIVAALAGIFSGRSIKEGYAEDDDEFALRPFLDAHRPALERVREEIRKVVADSLPPFEKGLQIDLLKLLEHCTEPGLAEDLLTRYIGFPFWDMLVFPLQSVSNVGERDHVEAYRISPKDTRLLQGKNLRGTSIFHFGAFFSRAGRESDYLWGRLDAAERLIKLLLDVRGHPPTLATMGAPSPAGPIVGPDELTRECVPAFRAILAEDGPALANAKSPVGALGAQVEALAKPPAADRP